MNPTTGAVGAFLLLFGFLFLTISSEVVYVIFGFSPDPPIPQVEMALAAVLASSAGAGLLIHGILSGRSEKEEEPMAETEKTA